MQPVSVKAGDSIAFFYHSSTHNLWLDTTACDFGSGKEVCAAESVHLLSTSCALPGHPLHALSSAFDAVCVACQRRAILPRKYEAMHLPLSTDQDS